MGSVVVGEFAYMSLADDFCTYDLIRTGGVSMKNATVHHCKIYLAASISLESAVRLTEIDHTNLRDIPFSLGYQFGHRLNRRRPSNSDHLYRSSMERTCNHIARNIRAAYVKCD